MIQVVGPLEPFQTNEMLDTIVGQSASLATFQGYELSKQKHILALQSDQDLITEVLRPLAQCCVGHVQSCRDVLFKRIAGKPGKLHRSLCHGISYRIHLSVELNFHSFIQVVDPVFW